MKKLQIFQIQIVDLLNYIPFLYLGRKLVGYLTL